ncbi:MAG: type IV secretion system DNA-binding domain-containing protein [Candidatus Kerfeldbacteria bacterium]|nr:type IV secretion system DNA-binding domain-containing protein [Candidatus Kerfeldbacteria bacterium]
MEQRGDIIYFARTNFRNQQKKFGIKLDDRRRHMYIIGKTGMGKTTVLENMMIQDVQNGHGLAVIDPHGDFVEKILDFIPSHRINDVIYINPADADFPVAFNVLESINPEHRHLVASGLLSVFKKMWVDSWGPRLEYILRICILSLMEYPGSTLLGITRILVDDDYRAKVVEKITDPIVKSFWLVEFSQYANQFRTEAIAPIQNKIGQFLSSVLIRNIVGQPKSTLDLREIMDSRKILLLNLSKGRIGEDNAGLLGGLMITKLQVAAMSRVDVTEKQRKDFFLYVDEFQNFATESFANILSEARKYRLNLIIAHQYIEQLDEAVQAAVFGNVGTLVCFRVGAGDAEFLAKEFAPVFDETDLVNLTKFDIYLRLMIDGVASEPFSAGTLPPISGMTGNREKVIRSSRERYSRPRAEIEEKISRWMTIEEMVQLQQTRGPGGFGNNRDRRYPVRRSEGGQRREGFSRRDEGFRRNEPRRDEPEQPKIEELQPVVRETGKEISLKDALAFTPPGGRRPSGTSRPEMRPSQPVASPPPPPLPSPNKPSGKPLRPKQVIHPK